MSELVTVVISWAEFLELGTRVSGGPTEDETGISLRFGRLVIRPDEDKSDTVRMRFLRQTGCLSLATLKRIEDAPGLERVTQLSLVSM